MVGVDPALLKSRQDTAAERAGINPILASARGASNAVTAMLASTLNNPLKPIRFGANIVETITGRTPEASSSLANGLINIAAINAEQPKTTIEPISRVVAENSKKIDEAIDLDTTTQAQPIMMGKTEPAKNKPTNTGLGDVEIA